MKELTKEQYIEKVSVSNYERAYLLLLVDNTVYLRANLDFGGEIGLRIEMMRFELEPELGFWKANCNCRAKYPGGIYFIEYDSYEEAEEKIIYDFLDLEENLIYLYCEDNELKYLVNSYPDKTLVYVVTD